MLKKYGFGEYNGAEETSGRDTEMCTIRIFFENGQVYQMATTQLVENYATFKEECVLLIQEYYLAWRDR